jgi:hypothetical protein
MQYIKYLFYRVHLRKLFSMGEKQRLLLVEDFVGALRWHPHLGNVLTHISSRNWQRVEESFAIFFDPKADVPALTPLSQNILELVCDNAGTTGRIMRPFLLEFLARNLASEDAASIEKWIRRLRASLPDHADAAPVRAPDRPGAALTRIAS